MLKHTPLFLTCLFVICFGAAHAQQTIYINEAMASNDETIADATGEYEDWFEIYNAGSQPFSLAGCYATNNISQPMLFRFSAIQVPAKGYLIIWASNDTTRGKTHVPFKLSASGAAIYLYAANGTTLLDSMRFGPQKTDISYGRLTDGSSVLRFFKTATPAATNNTSTAYLGVLNPPTFSVDAGYYASSFPLTISPADTGVQIVYTTDGSEPDENNLRGTVYTYKNKYPFDPGEKPFPFLSDSFRSVLYTQPVTVTDVSKNPNHLSQKSTTFDDNPTYLPTKLINKGLMVRARVVKAGYLSSDVVTKTYFVTPGGQNRYTLPVLSLALPPQKMFAWDSGIYVAGTEFDQWRLANPKAQTTAGAPANYRRDTTERSGSMEMFSENSSALTFQRNAGLGLHGGGSRSKPQKSFRVYLRDEYGSGDLGYAIFPDQPYTDYKRLIIRNGGSEDASTRIRDLALQKSIAHLRVNTQDGRPAIAFVDGEFWGLMDIRERYDWRYFNQKYGIGETEIDYLTNDARAEEGDNKDYVQLRSFISSNNMAVPANYDSVTHRIDIENYIDYYASEIFYCNTDWPYNNIGYYRKRVPYTPGAPYGTDGRYRWVVFDMDISTGYSKTGVVSFNSLQWATGTAPGGPNQNPAPWSTVILKSLTANADFRQQFVTRYADLLNSTFIPQNVISTITYYHDALAPHMAEHVDRWHHPSSVTAWNSNVNAMDTFVSQRPAYARTHLRSFFSLSAEKQLTVDVSDTAAGYVHVNTIDILPSFPGIPKKAYPWSGSYYAEVPVTLVAKAKPGYVFQSWQGDNTGTKDSILVTLNTAKSYKAIFKKMAADNSKILYYWHFNNLPTGTIDSVLTDTALLPNGKITYEGTGAGYMDATGNTEGSDVNAQFGEPAGTALRVRNPSTGRYLLMKFSTKGYKNIVLSYAATRTSKGAEYQRVLYSTDGGATWKLKADSLLIATPETTFGLQTFDFSAAAGVSNNANFAVKIEFLGANAPGSSGNDRFDNIVLKGISTKRIKPVANDMMIVQAPVATPVQQPAGLQVIPNPVRSNATVVFLSAKAEKVYISLVSAGGHVIRTVSLPAVKGSNTYLLDMSRYAKGVYYIQLRNAEGVQSMSLIKE